jgi:hypothetical protein
MQIIARRVCLACTIGAMAPAENGAYEISATCAGGAGSVAKSPRSKFRKF